MFPIFVRKLAYFEKKPFFQVSPYDRVSISVQNLAYSQTHAVVSFVPKLA